MVYLLVCVNGAALMALELVAFMLSARIFGSAYREITAVISVFLLGMSVGYWLGGRLGDWRPRTTTLVGVTFAGAGGIFLLRLLESWVVQAVFESHLPLKIHSLVASFILYFLPVVFLASTSPLAVRLLARELPKTGQIAGGVASLSTFGSLVGTLGTGFFLVEWMELYKILLILVAILMTSAFLVFLRAKWSVAVLCFMGSVSSWAGHPPEKLVLEKQTPYHHIRVVERGGSRMLFFDATLQSMESIAKPGTGFLDYVNYIPFAFIGNPHIRRVLVLGLGGGSIPKLLRLDYPTLEIDAVELDPVVVQVAKEQFGLREDSKFKLHVMDGRVFIKRAKQTYDLIIVDAYGASRYGLTIPRQLVTLEFFKEVARCLGPDGVLVYNIATNSGSYDNALNRALHRTIRDVFPIQNTWEVTDSLNSILIASKKGKRLTKEGAMKEAALLWAEGKLQRPERLQRVISLREKPTDLGRSVLLTDQFAPVDRLILDP